MYVMMLLCVMTLCVTGFGAEHIVGSECVVCSTVFV